MVAGTYRFTSPRIWSGTGWASSRPPACSAAIPPARNRPRQCRRSTMAHDIRAQIKHLAISAHKVRLVVDLVRGKDAVRAMDILRFAPQAAAQPVSKLLASAVANAEENFGVSRDDLVVA